MFTKHLQSHRISYGILILLMLGSSLYAEKWMTIFIHGTLGLKSSLSLGLLFNLWTDNIEHTHYVKQAKALRYNSRLFNEQAIQELGLYPIIRDNTLAYSGPYIFAHTYDAINKLFTNNNTENIYYTYGWSGLLSSKQRFKASYIFYEQLKNELARLKQKYPTIKIRIVGYSHGGNVALNLAAIQESYYPEDTLKINELILVGTPLQRKNRDLVYSPFFKKIYNIFSAGDKIQRIDIFSPGTFVSRKRFRKINYCPLPENLTQIRIRVLVPRGPECCNYRTYCPSTLPCIPFLLQDKSPGHFDLWLFGWNKRYYHQNNPFYPLPTSVFIPYITNAVKNYSGSLVTLTLLPNYEHSLLSVKYKSSGKVYKCPQALIPFLTTQQLNILRENALHYDPQFLNSNYQKYTNYCKIPALL